MLSFALLVLAASDVYANKLAHQLLADDLETVQVYPWLFYAHLLYVLVVVGLTLASCFILFKEPKKMELTCGMIAAVVFVSLSAIIATYKIFPHARSYIYTDIQQGGYDFVNRKVYPEYEIIRFHRGIDLEKAAHWGHPTFLAPSGRHKVTGKVSFNELPAITSIQLYLNDYWRTDNIKTDDHGYFSFSVGLSSIEINRIDMSFWFNKPDDGMDYMPVLFQPVLPFESSFFDDASYRGRIQTNDSRAEQNDFEIIIVPFINMIWPAMTKDVQQTGIGEHSIEWRPVKNASYYVIKFSRYSDPHSGYRVFSFRSREHIVALGDLPLAPTDTREIYYLDVSAFDDENRYLGSSKSGFSNMRFSIQGYKIVEESQMEDCCDFP